MLPASVGWLHAWVLTASVGADCERGCWLQAWVLAARVGAGFKHIVLDSRKVVGVKDL